MYDLPEYIDTGILRKTLEGGKTIYDALISSKSLYNQNAESNAAYIKDLSNTRDSVKKVLSILDESRCTLTNVNSSVASFECDCDYYQELLESQEEKGFTILYASEDFKKDIKIVQMSTGNDSIVLVTPMPIESNEEVDERTNEILDNDYDSNSISIGTSSVFGMNFNQVFERLGNGVKNGVLGFLMAVLEQFMMLLQL